MSQEHYLKAQKQGLKAYKDSISKGRYPYLPVLDEILSHAEIDGEVNLGVEDIPLNHVVGTSTAGRTQAFASNFTPLLDEFPEFPPKMLEALRQPLEDGKVTISRASGSYSYPSRFQLVCAMNPCKCGWYGDPSGRCSCSQMAVDSYRGRISGPLLDRIDIVVEVPAVHFEDLRARAEAEPSAKIKERVDKARKVQHQRFIGDGNMCNARMGPDEMRKFCTLDEASAELMKQAFDALGLTARSYDRILKVARTVADLEGSETIQPQHIAEAIQYRAVNLGNR